MPPSLPPTYATRRVSKLPCLHSRNGSFRALPACWNWCEWSWQLFKSYSVWLDMSLKQSVLSLFYFRIPRTSRPILTSFMRSPSDKRCLRRGKNNFLYCFLGGDKREMLSISQKQMPPLPMLPPSAPRGIEKEDRGPELVGLGYRAVSAVGGWQRTCSYGSKKGMINSLIVGNFHSSIF